MAVMVKRMHDINTQFCSLISRSSFSPFLSYSLISFSSQYFILNFLSPPSCTYLTSLYIPILLFITSCCTHSLPSFNFFITILLTLVPFHPHTLLPLPHIFTLTFSSQFVEEAWKSDSIILIHFMAGVSCSVTLSIANLMTYFGLTMQTSNQLVKDKWPVIYPNLNFMGQLVNYEEELMNVQDRTV